MKYILPFVLLIFAFSCKNPLSNSSTEDAPADFAIQNTENGKVLLRLNPEVDTKTYMQMKVNLKPTGMMIPMHTDILADFNMRAVEILDSTTSYHVDFQRIRMNAKILGMDIDYDSQGDNKDIPEEIKGQVEPLLGKKIVMKMDKLAKIQSLEFDDQKNQGNIDLNVLFIPLPNEEVGVGDSWTAKQNVQNVENAQLIYTVESISETEVLVKVTQAEDENSKVDGQYLIDRKTGFTKDGILNLETNEDGNGIKVRIVVDTIEEPFGNTENGEVSE